MRNGTDVSDITLVTRVTVVSHVTRPISVTVFAAGPPRRRHCSERFTAPRYLAADAAVTEETAEFEGVGWQIQCKAYRLRNNTAPLTAPCEGGLCRT
jgi:hypothetical protein